MTVKWFLFFILILSMVHCRKTKPATDLKTGQKKTAIQSDIRIGSKVIHDEIPGSAYRKRATRYFVIHGSDTSDFRPVFMESADGGMVSINMRFKKTLSYKEHIGQLKLILPFAFREYASDSLRDIYIGRLIKAGSLALQVTDQFVTTFGKLKAIRIADYPKIEQVLLTSELAKDLNRLLRPYGLSVEHFVIEKAFFATKNQFLSNNKIIPGHSGIPDKILDCQVGMHIRKRVDRHKE